MKKQIINRLIIHATFSKFLLITLISLNVLAGDITQSYSIPNRPNSVHTSLTNSTFSSDLAFPATEKSIYLSEEDQKKKLIGKMLFSRLRAEGLMAIQKPQDNAVVAVPETPGSPAKDPSDPQRMKPTEDRRFQWRPAMMQAMTFLWIEHGFRLLTEPSTRKELRGPYFADWWQSIKSTRGWRDGDPFIVNYIGHPMQGSVTNYIYVHNDPKSIDLEMGFNKDYFKSRMKAMLFSTIYSTQFELGPISEAALGNVGMFPSKTSNHPSAYVDLVITPTLGTVWMMGEDMLDRYVIKKMEDHVENRVVRILVRGFLNPSRSFANILRGRWMWYRDGRRL